MSIAEDATLTVTFNQELFDQFIEMVQPEHRMAVRDMFRPARVVGEITFHSVVSQLDWGSPTLQFLVGEHIFQLPADEARRFAEGVMKCCSETVQEAWLVGFLTDMKVPHVTIGAMCAAYREFVVLGQSREPKTEVVQ